ncbi:uncharacterized protein LOC144129414 [Amblyomma americanum]
MLFHPPTISTRFPSPRSVLLHRSYDEIGGDKLNRNLRSGPQAGSTTMAQPGESRSPTTAPFVVMASPCDPGTFSGTDGMYVEDWLRLYERVSSYDRMDKPWSMQHGLLNSLRSVGQQHIQRNGGPSKSISHQFWGHNKSVSRGHTSGN